MAEIETNTHALIDFSDPVVDAGNGHILARVTYEDREMIQMAASILGMKQADFVRTALIKSAKKIITENAR